MQVSAEYRSAGGREWHRVKSVNNTVKFDGPETFEATCRKQENADRDDEYINTKHEIKARLEQGYDPELITVVPEGKRGAKKSKRRGKQRLKNW